MSRGAAAGLVVAELEDLGLEALRDIWRGRFGAPPSLRSPELLALMLAWRIQAHAEGGLDGDVRRTLRRSTAPKAAPPPAPGVRLVREWQGVRHEVITQDDGQFLYQDRRYRSLSQIARQITGSRWNGPRFFGLRDGAAAA